MFDLTGNVAIVTGSSRGIGKATAEALAAAGAKVVITSRDESACEKVVESIRQAGGEAMAVACNISSKAQLQALVDTTMAQWKQIDILVCNAAANPHYGSLSEIPDEMFDKIMNNNVRSTLWLAKIVLPLMAARKSGSVVVMSSFTALTGNTTIGAYGVSKAAAAALTRNLAVEWGPHNIRVNCIMPGLIKTEFSAKLWENDEIYDATVDATALKRVGTSEDVAGVAVFLAAPASGYISGASLVVDGGLTITAKT